MTKHSKTYLQKKVQLTTNAQSGKTREDCSKELRSTAKEFIGAISERSGKKDET